MTANFRGATVRLRQPVRHRSHECSRDGVMRSCRTRISPPGEIARDSEPRKLLGQRTARRLRPRLGTCRRVSISSLPRGSAAGASNGRSFTGSREAARPGNGGSNSSSPYQRSSQGSETRGNANAGSGGESRYLDGRLAESGGSNGWQRFSPMAPRSSAETGSGRAGRSAGRSEERSAYGSSRGSGFGRPWLRIRRLRRVISSATQYEAAYRHSALLRWRSVWRRTLLLPAMAVAIRRRAATVADSRMAAADSGAAVAAAADRTAAEGTGAADMGGNIAPGCFPA